MKAGKAASNVASVSFCFGMVCIFFLFGQGTRILCSVVPRAAVASTAAGARRYWRTSAPGQGRKVLNLAPRRRRAPSRGIPE